MSAPHRLVGAALLVGVLGLSACASEPRESAATSAAPSTSSSTATTTQTPTPTPTPEPRPVRWPLTGLEGAASGPALAVKIENSFDARPQTGLNAADLVWEEVVEGGITRFVAVYHSSVPGEIGPVRSVRPMDPAIVGPLHGLLAFSGGQPPFVHAVGAAGLQVVSHDAGAGGFYRVSGRYAPHNIYADPHALLAQADAAHQAAPPRQFIFPPDGEKPTAMTAGRPTNVVDLRLSYLSHPSWTWSPSAGRWVRAESGSLALEANGEPLRAANVVVLRVDVVSTPFVDAAGTHVPETVMVGSGQALVATGGHTVAATWSKSSVTAPLVLTGPGGGHVWLAPGNTWIELVPNGTGAVAVG